MTFVLDTALLLDHLRSVPGATRAFDDALLSGRRVTGSVLSRVELRRAARGRDLEAIETLELLLDWVPVDHAIASSAADLAAVHGDAISPVDYVIAATTRRLSADLLTCHPERFPMFPDLEPPY